jgi:uncharacterized protein with FMN-binding domain
MKRRESPTTVLSIISAVLLATGHLNSAAAQTQPSLRQEQPQRSRYADGIYTAIGRYGGQPSFITVTVTLRSGLIAAVEVEPHATVPRSLEFQRRFAAAVPKVVIGKPIDQVQVGKLAGSSGTPRGFNDAIQKIKQQAAS